MNSCKEIDMDQYIFLRFFSVKNTFYKNPLGVRSMAVFVSCQTLVFSRVRGLGTTNNESFLVVHNLNAANRVVQLLLIVEPRNIRGWVSVHLTLDVNVSTNSNLVAVGQGKTGGYRNCGKFMY